MPRLTAIEFCAGAGGQALGIEQAGFHHVAAVEIDKHAAATLRLNRPHWHVLQTDMRTFDATAYKGVDLFAAGLPCPPFSLAGKQLGSDDERNLFPAAYRLIGQLQPRAVMIENVRGLLKPRFDAFRADIDAQLEAMGYITAIKLLQARDFSVPQLRPRVIIVAMKPAVAAHFQWPKAAPKPAPTVGEALHDLMSANGWPGAARWKLKANRIAPTLVGGSKKHGGPDLGPTRAKRQWAALGVDGKTLAADAPASDYGADEMPRLTVRMCARLQGFPDDWQFSGRKTNMYRQVGNALPPPLAHAVASALRHALLAARDRSDSAAALVNR